MIRVHLGPQALARVRLTYSPMWELSQSLRHVVHDPGNRSHAGWLRQAVPRLDPETLLLLRGLMPNPYWFPDFLSPPPGDKPRSLRTELRNVAALTAGELRSGIAATSSEPLRQPLAAVLAGPNPGAVLAKALGDYWQQGLADHWPRLRRLLESDLAFRADGLAANGLHVTLNSLHGRIAFDGDVLSLGMRRRYDVTREHVDGLALVPCAFASPDILVVVAKPAPVTLAYPPRGVAELWTADSQPAAAGPSALMGRSRAAILAILDRPMNATEIAEQTGLSAPAVSEHLAVLRDTGLVESRRSGRTVWSVRTRLGSELLQASDR